MAYPAHAQDAAPEPVELYRIRLENREGGAIEVSGDGGRLWDVIGHVNRPATALSSATSLITAVRPSSVAGVTPEQISIRVPAAKEQYRVLRVTAKEQPEAAAAIGTDLLSASPLFRCIAPPAGSAVQLERNDKSEPLPANYLPQPGDRLVIIVRRGATFPAEVVIENRVDGKVTLTTGAEKGRAIARVKQPLRGIGRYAGTERAGAGALISWSPTVVVVSTASMLRRLDEKDQLIEERGGFIIQPAEPQLQGTTSPASQILIEALPTEQGKPVLSTFFGLPIPLTSGDALDGTATRVEMRLDEGEWEPLPDLRGPVAPEKLTAALQEAVGQNRTVKDGITHLRIVFDNPTPAALQRRLKLATTAGTETPQRGTVKITANVMGDGIVIVSFFLDGALTMATNRAPYTWEWNTLKAANGPHLVEIRGTDDKGAVVTSVTRRVFVDN